MKTFLLAITILTMVYGEMMGQARPAGGRRGSSIVDDSTKQVYGPTTSRYLYERDIRKGQLNFSFIDTTIIDYHKQFDPIDKGEYKYQDLGNIGTAIRPLFYSVPDQIGAWSGYDVYDYYMRSYEDIQYYDTKSPFSFFSIFWGDKGRAVTDAGFSRNINERWNFGLDYKNKYIDKLIGRRRRGDRNVENVSFDLYTWYRSKDLKYDVLGNYIRTKHKVNEMGGVIVDSIDTPVKEYYNTNASPRFTEAKGIGLRSYIHTFQRYALNDWVRVFHSFDYGKQENEFFDFPLRESNVKFDHVEIVFKDTVSDKSRLKEMVNKGGISGGNGNYYYELYYKNRDIKYSYSHLDTDSLGIPVDFMEHYTGFSTGGSIDSLVTYEVSGEYLFGGNHKLHGRVDTKWTEFYVTKSLYEPSFMQKAYRGHFDYWVNEFVPISTIQTHGALKLNTDFIFVRPFITYTTLTNNVYFSKVSSLDTVQQVVPVQADRSAFIFQGGVDVKFKLKKFTIMASAINTHVNGGSSEGVQIPFYFLNGRAYFHDIFFDGNLDLQVGVDVNWKSDYFAPGYDPVIQQFYIQDEFMVKGYWLCDAYINAKFDVVRVFFKVNNIGSAITQSGYLITPYYPGIGTFFDVGFNWSFYE